MMECPYCGSDNCVEFYNMEYPVNLSCVPKEILGSIKSHPITLNICKDCLLGFNSTPLSENVLEDIYKHYVYIRPSINIGHTGKNNIIRLIKEYASPNWRIVEIGSSEGFILKKLEEDGFTNLIGVEPSDLADEHRSSGISIIKDFFRADFFEPESLDLFILSHVFEHFSDPFQIFDDMLKCLKPSGKIIIEVPDFEGYHHQHLYYYSPDFFKRLAIDKGVYIQELSRSEFGLSVVFSKNIPITQNIQTSYDTLAKAEKTEERIKKTVSILCSFLNAHSGEAVFWWGAGSFSVMLLGYLKQFMPNADIRVLDNDPARWGHYIPGTNFMVEASDVIAGKSINALVIASQYVTEILESIDKKGAEVKEYLALFKHWNGK